MKIARITSALCLAAAGVFFMFPLGASAHEAYVLDQNFFWSIMHGGDSMRVLLAVFHNTEDMKVTIEIAGAVIALLIANFLFRRTAHGRKVNDFPTRFSRFGPQFVRIAVASAFFFGARSMSFLGPELHMADMPWPHLMQLGLYTASAMILVGFLTELAALIALVIFSIGFFTFGTYLITYLNYLGEIVALFLFGERMWSLDGVMFGARSRFRKLAPYRTTIIRVFYGAALLWAAVTVKLLHPELTIQVVTQWNLTRFHWLFPHDPLLVTLGAGIVEALIGIFIIVGFEMRMTILISLFYITLSLLYFRELVWPHIMLYGISFSLLVEPERFTIDSLLFGKKKR